MRLDCKLICLLHDYIYADRNLCAYYYSANTFIHSRPFTHGSDDLLFAQEICFVSGLNKLQNVSTVPVLYIM